MEDKNSELLFEYLRSILYDKKIQPLDVEQLDEPFRKLGRGLQYFARRLQKQNSTQQPFREEICQCSRLRGRIFCAKI